MTVFKAPGVKCPRCYHVTESINHDGLCNRCVAIITKHFPHVPAYQAIIDNLSSRGLSPEDNPEYLNV